MRVGVPREIRPDEARVALVPESCRKLVKAGLEVAVESRAGERAFLSDEAYTEAGAVIEPDAGRLLGSADMVLKVQPPMLNSALGAHEADLMKPGAIVLSSLLPTKDLEAVSRLAQRGITGLSVEAIPRITRAQSMDVLSSMASLAGYRAVLLAAVELPRYFPMMMTAAGTVLPAKVFVIGAGVAGLQAIATARRLGAVVEATDTRPAVKQEIQSLGARFVGVETAEEAQDAGGYAKALSEEYYRQQAELIARHCAASDVVITTALIGGVKAPRLITADMVKRMKPGAVIVDLAAPAGGNCEVSEPGKKVVRDGVTVLAPTNLPSEMPSHSSLLLSRNLTAFVLAFWKEGRFGLDLEDDILKAITITHEGRVLHAGAAQALRPEETTA